MLIEREAVVSLFVDVDACGAGCQLVVNVSGDREAAIAKGGEIHASYGIAVAFDGGGSGNGRVDSIGDFDGNCLSVCYAGGGAKDGN